MVRCTACTARATIAHATQEQTGRGKRSQNKRAHKTLSRATLSRARPRPHFLRARPICRARDLSGAGDSGVQDSISRARPFGRARPRVSRRIPLIPLNPGESRFEKVAGFPRASCTITCARAIGQGERTALEGCESLPGVRCVRIGPALQSSRRCGLGGPCDRPNDGTVGPRRRTVEAPWRCGSARSSRKPASCTEE